MPFPIDEVPLTGFVDPMIGSAGSGNVIPGALVPHGMVRLSPDTLNYGGDVGAYEGNNDRIEGFTHTHWEGPGGGFNGYSQLLVLPQTGPLVVERNERTSLFSHDEETAPPRDPAASPQSAAAPPHSIVPCATMIFVARKATEETSCPTNFARLSRCSPSCCSPSRSARPPLRGKTGSSRPK